MKRFFLFLSFVFLFALVGCSDDVSPLAKARQNAVDEISNYVSESNYSVSDYNLIVVIIADAKTEIYEAEDETEINAIVVRAKLEIDQVPELAEDENFILEKENIVLELEKFGDENEYSESKWQEVVSLIELKSIEIMAALTIEEANLIYLESLQLLYLIENIHAEYAIDRLSAIDIPTTSDENFDLILTDPDSDYVVFWSVVQGTAITIVEGEAIVLRAFEDVDVIINVDFLKDDEVVFSKDYFITILAKPLEVVDVSDTKDLFVGETIILKGLVVGVASNGNVGGQEVIIKDLLTSDYVGVRSMPGTYPNYDVKKGDIIEFMGVIDQGTTTGDVNKKYVDYQSNLEIISSDNEIVYGLGDAKEITSQDDLIDLINNADVYQLVKFTTSIFTNKYGSTYETYYNRFTLDSENKSYDSIKINGIPPALQNGIVANNIGYGWTDVMFGINSSNFAGVSTGFPGYEYDGDVYMMFIGGNNYYYQFVIFENSHIVPTVLKNAKAQAVDDLNNYLASLDENTYTEENWLLLNGSILNDGLDAINESGTVLEVETALLNAKTNMNNVEKIISVEYVVEFTLPTKREYFVNEQFEVDGGKITIKVDGEVFHELDLTMDTISGFDSSEPASDQLVTITVLYSGETFTETFTVDILEAPTRNVSDVKGLEMSLSHKFTGLVVATAGNGNTGGQEVIIKDLVTFEYVGVRSMPGTYPAYTVNKGDVIEFVASIIVSAAPGDLEKRLLVFESDLEVISSDNEVTYDLDNAILIEDQQDLIDFINNVGPYKLVKITSDIYSNKYGAAYAAYYNRFTLSPDNKSYESIKINNLSPALKNDYISNNIGEGWTDVMFGVNEDNFADITGSYPGIQYEGELYTLFIGGNSYYYQFIILEQDHIITPEKLLALAKEAAVLELNEYLGLFEEDDYSEENWLLLNGSILNDGIDAINDSLTMEEVEIALLNAKASMNEIEKAISLDYDALFTLPIKTVYYVNEELDLSGGKIVITVDDEVVFDEDLTANMISGFDSSEVAAEQLITITVLYAGETFIKTYTVDIIEVPTRNVSDVKGLDEGVSAKFTGIVIGTAGNGNAAGTEVIIKDLVTFEYVGVRSMPGDYPEHTVNKGDVIEFVASVIKSTAAGDLEKKLLVFESDLEIISSDNEVTYDLDNAILIEDQQDLIDFINNDGPYKLVKITSDIYSNKYGSDYSAYYNRFTLDPENKGLSSIKINDLSPALRNNVSSNNIGDGWTDVMFGINEDNFADITGSYPGIKYEGELYTLFIGGNSFYYQFAIFENDHIIPMPGRALNRAKEAAILELNEYLGLFKEDNYTEENWALLNGSILNDGLDAIDESETIIEVEIALLAAKNNLDSVEKIVPVEYVEEFILPTKREYYVEEELDLAGGKIVIKVDDEVVYEEDLIAEMVSGFDSSQVASEQLLTITVLYAGETFVKTFTVDIVEAPTRHVSEVKGLDEGALAKFTGLVIGTASNGNAGGQEIIIKDLVTFDYVGVRSMPGTYPEFTVKKGDVIEFKASVIKAVAASIGDMNKKLLSYKSDLEVISSDNEVTYDLDNAILIEEQQDLIDFINNVGPYNLVKITSDIYSNKYGTTYATYYNRFTLDVDNTTYNSIKINGISPALKNDLSTNNIGDGWTDVMFGVNEGNIADITGSYPGILYEGELYTMLIGGNAYYYQFVIFEQNHITPMPGRALNRAKEAAVLELNEYLLLFEEDDYTEENWALLNGSILNDGQNAIDESETVLEVETALLAAKNNLDSVEKIVPVEYVEEFILPTKREYYVDEELDLTGGKIIIKVDDEVVYEEDLTVEMVSGFDSSEVAAEQLLTITVLYAGETFVKTFTVDIVEAPTRHVSEVKGLDEGAEAKFTGLVVGTAANGNAGGQEVIIKDLVTFDYVGVRSMPGTYPEFTVKKGDVIEFVASVTKSVAAGDLNKKLLVFKSDLEIISSDNDVTYDLDNAILIEEQQDLIDFINNDGPYNLIKITSNIYSNIYRSASTVYPAYYNRITLDPENKSLASIKVNNLSLALKNDYSSNNIGDGWTDLMFGVNEGNFADLTPSYPGIQYEGELYTLFIGGNAYYYQFVIFEQDHITPMPGRTLNLAKEAAVLELNEYLGLFKEENYTEENWALLNGSVLNAGIDSINSSLTIEEVELALINAKANLDDVERLVEVTFVSIETMPDKLTYGHREGIKDIDLTGGELKVTYSDDSSAVIDMTNDMLQIEESDDWKIGEVTYELTYSGKTISLTVTFENQAISVSEFKTKETGGVYDVTGLVVGPMSSFGVAELLIMDKDNKEIIGVSNSGIVGTYLAPSLNTEVLNVGDEIIVRLTVVKTDTGVNADKIMGSAVNNTTFTSNLIMISSNNDIVHNLDESNVTTISTQEELTTFLNSSDKFYSYVKFVGVKAVTYNAHYRVFFDDDIKSLAAQKVEVNGVSSSPDIYGPNNDEYIDGDYRDYFDNNDSTSYNDPVTTTYDIILLYVGGNQYYLIFGILEESWFIKVD